MNEKQNSYWLFLKQSIISNKIIFFSAIITSIACFGFTITNFSIGVDDPLREYYLSFNSWGSMIQQGRLLHLFLNLFTGLFDFIPFLNDFIAASLFTLSSFLFAALIQYISNNRFSTLSISAFCCIYISYSIITEKFIYNLDVIATMLSYCCTALSLTYSHDFIKNGDRKSLVLAIILLFIAIGSYESFICLYFCGVFGIFIIQSMTKDEKLTWKEFFLKGLKYAMILVIAVVAYYLTVVIVQLISGQFGIFKRYNTWNSTPDFFKNLSNAANSLIKGFWVPKYLPMLEFAIASAVGVVFFTIYSFKKRSPILFVCYLCLFIGNLLIHISCGYYMFRASQTFCFFIALLAILIIHEASKTKTPQKILAILVALLVTVQTADMNRWFYNDYNRYQKDSFVINSIATRLAGECDLSKPVVFLNTPSDGYLNNLYFENQVNGHSLVYWGISGFSGQAMYYVFDAYGYDFIKKPTEEQIENARELLEKNSDEIGAWPSKSCIYEAEDFIIVNFDY